MNSQRLDKTTTPQPAFVGLAGLQMSQGFLEALPMAIYACAADGRLLWFNERACRLWGRRPRIGDPSEFYCGSHKVFLNDRQLAPDETPMALVLGSGEAICGAEARVERPDGSVVWATVHIEPVLDEAGKAIGAINCFHESPGPPRDQERRLAATYESAGIGIAEIDRDGRLQRVNPHLRELLQYPEDLLVGQSIFDLTHPRDVERDQEQLRRQVAREIECYTIETRLRRSDGEYIWASVTSSSVRDPDGTFLYAVRVQQDITQRKASEENLARFSIGQASLHELTARLQRASSAAEIYAAAMDAMFRSLDCARASILLVDRQGDMRFVAARGLSPGYMRAVDGHSPWTSETQDAKPIYVRDIRTSDLSADLQGTVLGEGIQALAFIPLQGADRLLGKFMLYYDQPKSFAAREIEIAITIARHVSFGLERLQALRSAQQLAAIVESSSDAIVSKDLNGRIMTWNHAAERLFGYSAEEAVGQSITLLIPPERLAEEPAILARIRAGERVEHFETIRRHKNGRLIDISLTISPIRDGTGRIIGASKIARDISDRKAADKKLRESETRLQELLSAIPAAIYTTDAEGRITYFNDAAVEFAGRRPVLGLDRWCVTEKLFWPDGRPLPHDQCPMAVAIKEGKIVRGVEAVAERPDGARIPFIPHPTPLRDGEGRLVGGINMLVDISARKEAENQQRLLLNELNHRVKNNMQMLQSLLSSAARRAHSSEARRHLEDASFRVSALAAAQRVLYGQSGAEHFNTAELLKAVCETAKQGFPAATRILFEADQIELPNDVAMPLALIVNELLTNAVKHGPGGAASIDVSLKSLDGRLTLSVEDDGPGFELEKARQGASGLRLIDGLARQLGSTLRVSRTPRACVSMEFSPEAHL